MKSISVGICGIQGYVGQELARLVLDHPHLQLTKIFARKPAAELCASMPLLTEHNIEMIAIDDIGKYSKGCDVILLATPAETAMELVPKAMHSNVKVIDLSGAFRLPEYEFTEWYGMSHSAANLLDKAVYGLSPWWTKTHESKNIQLIANPGCYATCALMSLIPLLRENIIAPNNIIIDAKSGASGAGKKANEDLLFCEISNNFFPYKIGKHQHMPEIKQALTHFSGKSCQVWLTTHMLPLIRGISMTIYVDPINYSANDNKLLSAIAAAYQSAYDNYPFCKFVGINSENAIREQFFLSLKNVIGTPEIRIGYFIRQGKICIFASMDNLLKGAASQAIENINLIFNLSITTGLQSRGILS